MAQPHNTILIDSMIQVLEKIADEMQPDWFEDSHDVYQAKKPGYDMTIQAIEELRALKSGNYVFASGS